MITITCTNCQTSLTMDDAFAGGVCRCQHCGTIQTVPKSAKHGVASTAGTGSKTLWKQKTASDTSAGTGLDDLADIVASSGLAGSGLQSGGLRKRTPPPGAAANKKMLPIMAGVGGGIAVLMIVVIWFLIKGDDPAGEQVNTDGPSITTGGVETPPVTVAGPSFARLNLKSANTVAYVMDRGGGSVNIFGDLRTLTLKSIASLGADRKFQVVFWQVRDEIYAYPENGATVAGDTSVNEATRKLNDEVHAFGSSSVGPALKKAAAAKPDVIILATGKGPDLDDKFMEDVKANRPAGVKIHTFNLGSGDAPMLKQLASETGGEYHILTDAELKSLGR